MEHTIFFDANSAIGKGLKDWWLGLENDPGTRAMLRRCATLDDIVLSPAYQRFYRYMLTRGWPAGTYEKQTDPLDKLAAVAGLAAWVKIDTGTNLPHQMSELVGDRPVVSELRFRALLKVETTDDLFVALRRALPLIDHKTSVLQLANDVFRWDDITKKRWAYAYRWQDKKKA